MSNTVSIHINGSIISRENLGDLIAGAIISNPILSKAVLEQITKEKNLSATLDGIRKALRQI